MKERSTKTNGEAEGHGGGALYDSWREAASEGSQRLLSWSGRTLYDLKNPTFTSFLDLTRWVSAGIVFLGHLRGPLFSNYESLAAADRGLLVNVWFLVTGWFGEAVIVFFVLSGYLVGGLACAKSAVGRFEPIDYVIDRATRIFLPFLPALILTALCDALGMTFFGDVGLYNHTQPQIHAKINTDAFATYFTLDIFLKNVLMLQTIASPPFGSNQPLWTISLEFWFYVTFGILLTGMTGKGKPEPWIWIVAAVALAALLGGNFLAHMGLWMIGVGAGFVGRSRCERPLAACFAFFACLLSFRFIKGTFGFDEMLWLRNYVVAVFFAWLLVSMRGARWSLLEYTRPFNTLLSSFSYSLYLIHFPLMLLLLGALYHTGYFPRIAQGYAPTDPRGLLAYALVVIMVGLCAFGFSRATEQQTTRVRKLLKRHQWW